MRLEKAVGAEGKKSFWSEQKKGIAMLAAGVALDFYTTTITIDKFGIQTELNPIVQKAIDAWGTEGGLGLVKLGCFGGICGIAYALKEKKTGDNSDGKFGNCRISEYIKSVIRDRDKYRDSVLKLGAIGNLVLALSNAIQFYLHTY